MGTLGDIIDRIKSGKMPVTIEYSTSMAANFAISVFIVMLLGAIVFHSTKKLLNG